MSIAFIFGDLLFVIVGTVAVWKEEFILAFLAYGVVFLCTMIWNAVDVIGERLDEIQRSRME